MEQRTAANANRENKDSLFSRYMFDNPRRLIKVYNAIAGTYYPLDIPIDFNTLDGVLFNNRYLCLTRENTVFGASKGIIDMRQAKNGLKNAEGPKSSSGGAAARREGAGRLPPGKTSQRRRCAVGVAFGRVCPCHAKVSMIFHSTLDNKFIILIEHRSTVNENIPLRMLLYPGRLYEKTGEQKYISEEENPAAYAGIYCIIQQKGELFKGILSEAFGCFYGSISHSGQYCGFDSKDAEHQIQ